MAERDDVRNRLKKHSLTQVWLIQQLGLRGIVTDKTELIGVVGSVIASLFGGWDAALVTLVIFMAIDYVTGLLVAGVFHNSGKTENGALESRAGWKGLCRKCITLLMVLVATRLDLVTGTNFIRDAVVIAFIANETISIVENAGLMGINIPPAITQAIEVLKKKSDSADKADQ